MAWKRWLSSDDARKVRQQWHDDALEFALSIWLDQDYRNDAKAKKDVIDPSWDAHSVKSWEKKWQIFLYWVWRFEADEAFAAMNWIWQILIQCINSFPVKFSDYEENKKECKENLRQHMRLLKEKLSEPFRLKAFLWKSMFNWWEVDYLTVKHKWIFHVFYYKDVITVLSENFDVQNSQARSAWQFPEQKVILRYGWVNVWEIEMRNDSEVHYREIRFNMMKVRFMNLMWEKIPNKIQYRENVFVYWEAIKRFWRW